MAKELLDAQTPLSAANVESLVLYNSAASPSVRRCRITLLEKGLDYDTVEMDLPNMEHRSPEYLALNPNGYVPTISHGEHVVYDSAAINEYLDTQFPKIALFPASPPERAQVRMWIGSEETMSNEFRPLLYQRVMGPIQHISRSLEEARQINRRCTSDPIDMAWGDRIWRMQVLTPGQQMQQERKLMRWLDTVEQSLKNQDYLVGNQFTQADISVFPRVMMYSYLGLKIDEASYPNVLTWIKRLETRPSFENSMSAQAKKLRKMATSPLLPKLRRILGKPETKRNVLDKLFIWGLGRALRKIQKVATLLAAPDKRRDLPMPKPRLVPIDFSLGEKPHELENSNSIDIYGSALSHHSQRIVILVKFLGLTYTFHEIDLTSGENKKHKFLKLNPLGEVPVLKHGERVIHDSRAIAEYLLENFDQQQLWFGKNSYQAAQNRMWLGLEAGTHKEFKPLWSKYSLKHTGRQLSVEEEYSAIERIEQKLMTLEDTLSEAGFLCGEKMRYADIAWFTRLESMKLVVSFSMEKFPNLARWYSLMQGIVNRASREMYENKSST